MAFEEKVQVEMQKYATISLFFLYFYNLCRICLSGNDCMAQFLRSVATEKTVT
jgi:hypothetical protein